MWRDLPELADDADQFLVDELVDTEAPEFPTEALTA